MCSSQARLNSLLGRYTEARPDGAGIPSARGITDRYLTETPRLRPQATSST